MEHVGDVISVESVEEMSISALEALIKTRHQLLQLIQEAVTFMNEMNRIVQITDIAGSSTSLTGGCMAIAGLLGAPFTLGGSLSLTAVGSGLSVFGTATSVVANGSRHFITKRKRKEMNILMEKDKTLTEQLWNHMKNMNTVKTFAEAGVKIIPKYFPKFTRVADTIADVGSGFKIFGKTSGKVLAGIGIPFDTFSIISNLSDIYSGKENELALELSKKAEILKESIVYLNKVLNAMQ